MHSPQTFPIWLLKWPKVILKIVFWNLLVDFLYNLNYKNCQICQNLQWSRWTIFTAWASRQLHWTVFLLNNLYSICCVLSVCHSFGNVQQIEGTTWIQKVTKPFLPLFLNVLAFDPSGHESIGSLLNQSRCFSSVEKQAKDLKPHSWKKPVSSPERQEVGARSRWIWK